MTKLAVQLAEIKFSADIANPQDNPINRAAFVFEK